MSPNVDQCPSNFFKSWEKNGTKQGSWFIGSASSSRSYLILKESPTLEHESRTPDIGTVLFHPYETRSRSNKEESHWL